MLVLPVHLDLPPEIDVAAVATAPAVRLDPPTTTEADAPSDSHSPGSSASAGGRCVGWEPLLTRESPGWSVERMSRIMYRESRCQPEVRNRSSSATGLLQILASHCPWLARQMGTWCTRDRLNDPEWNVQAAAVLWREQGYGAWSTS
jgi:hypothetical protein